MVTQLVEDLLHLEGCGDRLDEHGRADRAVGHAEQLLGQAEDVVPQPRLTVRLELRQVEVRAAAARDEFMRVVECVEAEVDERRGCGARDAGAVGEAQVLLDEVPAARAEHDRGRLLAETVLLALGAREVDLTTDRVEQVDLAADDVRPGGARGVLVVGEPDLRAGVHGVDGHLAVGGSGDLHPAVLEAGAGARDAPVDILADRARLRQEVQVAPVLDAASALHPGGERLVAAPDEALMQPGEEAQSLRGQDLVEALALRAEHLHPCIHVISPSRRSWSCDRVAGVISPATRSRLQPRHVGQWNWADSVEPTRARVAESGLSAVAMRSK